MALRSQREDEIERAKKENFGSAWVSLVIIFIAAAWRGWAWLFGGYSAAFESFLVWTVVVFIAWVGS